MKSNLNSFLSAGWGMEKSFPSAQVFQLGIYQTEKPAPNYIRTQRRNWSCISMPYPSIAGGFFE